MAASCLFFAAAVGQAPEPPKFRATFVEDSLNQGPGHHIYDAKPNLSALGVCISRTSDTIRGDRIWIEEGKHIKRISEFWPFAFIDDSQVQGYVGDFCPFLLDEEDRLNVFTASASGRSQKIGRQPSVSIAQKSALQFKPLKEITTFDPSWWPKSKPTSERTLDGSDLNAESAETDAGTFVNLDYSPITPGFDFCLPFMSETAPLIKTATGYDRLENHLVGSKDLELGKIVWADKSGWVIVVCTRGEQWGLAWLFPVQSRQAGN
jgi:hypothetical protein